MCRSDVIWRRIFQPGPVWDLEGAYLLHWLKCPGANRPSASGWVGVVYLWGEKYDCLNGRSVQQQVSRRQGERLFLGKRKKTCGDSESGLNLILRRPTTTGVPNSIFRKWNECAFRSPLAYNCPTDPPLVLTEEAGQSPPTPFQFAGCSDRRRRSFWDVNGPSSTVAAEGRIEGRMWNEF